MEDLQRAKRALRGRAKRNRDLAAETAGPVGERLSLNLETSVKLPGSGIVSGFYPIGSEIDPMPTLARMRSIGYDIVLPVTGAPGEGLVFRRWHPDDPMASGPFGIQEPMMTAEALIPDILLVPMLAFDRRGYRLGYGGGFYDRTLERLRETCEPLAIGVAYAAQEVDAVPVGKYDQPLNWVVTEREAMEIGI